METMHYIGFDVHKKTISYCIKNYQGCALDRGTIRSTRSALFTCPKGRIVPWIGAMEATMFTGWICDFLMPHAAGLCLLSKHQSIIIPLFIFCPILWTLFGTTM
ncbi:hypothetical protein [Desulforhopalus singaporensis]|uniref:Transposase n=1 Tax=Desulforhopalus singaporensis TaxID=91360 RepID=A0A1H0V8E6_9BACT|nr:hypothetical protein [Desulforhopalus singaporensis]SDP74829.1 hypothetical protein SAMN05660330_03934 [Desulforhopalus singaporensis]